MPKNINKETVTAGSLFEKKNTSQGGGGDDFPSFII